MPLVLLLQFVEIFFLHVRPQETPTPHPVNDLALAQQNRQGTPAVRRSKPSIPDRHHIWDQNLSNRALQDKVVATENWATAGFRSGEDFGGRAVCGEVKEAVKQRN